MRAQIFAAALMVVASAAQAQDFKCKGSLDDCKAMFDAITKATDAPTRMLAGCNNKGIVADCASQASVDAIAKRLGRIECEVVYGRGSQLSLGALRELCK